MGWRLDSWGVALDVKLWQGSVLRLSQWLSLNWGQDSERWVPEVGVLNFSGTVMKAVIFHKDSSMTVCRCSEWPFCNTITAAESLSGRTLDLSLSPHHKTKSCRKYS